VQEPVRPAGPLQPEEPEAARLPVAVLLPLEREQEPEPRFDCTRPANSPLQKWQGYSVISFW